MKIELYVWENLVNGTVAIGAKSVCESPVTVALVKVIYTHGDAHNVTDSGFLPAVISPELARSETPTLAHVQPPYLADIGSERGPVRGLEVGIEGEAPILIESSELVSQLVRSSAKAMGRHLELRDA
ncbi:MAG: hypothetical protein H6827_07560 [Planctomycetes bacterium]|nr:hypothetical protein [Planctomycetota bacterium]